MAYEQLKKIISKKQIYLKKHAFMRMFQRKITINDVKNVFEFFDVIEEYPDDKPFASYLIFGYSGNTPVHMVISVDYNNEALYIITVYEPSDLLWEADMKPSQG